jgi:hypothetical protein
LLLPPKAAVNAPQSRRFASQETLANTRSVWTAVALAPLWQTQGDVVFIWQNPAKSSPQNQDSACGRKRIQLNGTVLPGAQSCGRTDGERIFANAEQKSLAQISLKSFRPSFWRCENKFEKHHGTFSQISLRRTLSRVLPPV